MGVGWNPIGFHLLSCFCFVMIQKRSATNSDGLALLEFRARIHSDPPNAFGNWDSNDSKPCIWFGVHCRESKVQMLDLSALSLEGTLAPELGKLSDLRSLVLYKNRFSDVIPKEFGDLTKLELLDLRENNLSGKISAEIGRMLSLRCLLLCDNKFDGCIPGALAKLNLLSELKFDENLMSRLTTGTLSVNRKFGLWFKLQKDSQGEHQGVCFSDVHGSSEQQMAHDIRNLAPFVRHRLLEQSKNLPAAPAAFRSTEQIIDFPTARSSGSFPATPKITKKLFLASNMVQSSPTSASTNLWKYMMSGL